MEDKPAWRERAQPILAGLGVLAMIVASGVYYIVWNEGTRGRPKLRALTSPDSESLGDEQKIQLETLKVLEGFWRDTSGPWVRFGKLVVLPGPNAPDDPKEAFEKPNELILTSDTWDGRNLSCEITIAAGVVVAKCEEPQSPDDFKSVSLRACTWLLDIRETSKTTMKGIIRLDAKESDPDCQKQYPQDSTPFAWRKSQPFE